MAGQSNLIRRIVWTIVGVVVLSLHYEAGAQPRAEAVVGRIDARLEQAESERGFSGVVLVSKGKQILLNKGYGYAEPDSWVENAPDRRFMIASVSKAFVAACILQLEDKGRLKTKDPIGQYLDGYPEWCGQNISIHHLLTHTSGIPDYINDFPVKFKVKQMTGWTPSKEELVTFISGAPLHFFPGEKFKYSNSGYVLLARIVETVSGMEYNEYLQKNILGPLGMNDSGEGDFDQVVNRAVAFKGKGKRKRTLENFRQEWIFGMGAMYSTTSDLQKWLLSFNDTLILSRASQAKMFSSEKNNYGYGWHVYEVFGNMQYSHGGYLPGWNSYVYFYPADTIAIVVLSNVEHSNPLEICGTISRILYINKLNQNEYFAHENVGGRYEILPEAEIGQESPFEAEIVTVNESKGCLAVKTLKGETIQFSRLNSGEWQDQQAQMRLQFREAGGHQFFQVTRNGKSWRWQKLSGDNQLD